MLCDGWEEQKLSFKRWNIDEYYGFNNSQSLSFFCYHDIDKYWQNYYVYFFSVKIYRAKGMGDNRFFKNKASNLWKSTKTFKIETPWFTPVIKKTRKNPYTFLMYEVCNKKRVRTMLQSEACRTNLCLSPFTERFQRATIIFLLSSLPKTIKFINYNLRM